MLVDSSGLSALILACASVPRTTVHHFISVFVDSEVTWAFPEKPNNNGNWPIIEAY